MHLRKDLYSHYLEEAIWDLIQVKDQISQKIGGFAVTILQLEGDC